MMPTGETIDDWPDDRWAKLLEAYCRTDYYVASPDQPLNLHVGEIDPQQNLSLIQAGVMSWCLVTAWNPSSQIRSSEENEQAQSVLKHDIEQLGLKWWEAAGRDPSGEWPAEDSCFVLNILSKDAMTLCLRHRQIAVLYGDTEHEPWLLFANWGKISGQFANIVSSGMIPDSVAEQLQGTLSGNSEM